MSKLIISLAKIKIEKIKSSDFENIIISSDLFIILSINKTITGNPKLIIDLSLLPFCLMNTSFVLSETEFSINLMDYYNLDQKAKDAVDKTSQSSNTGNILIFLGMIANIIAGSQAGLFLKGMMLIDLIHLTKFITLNYPPNIISLYLSRTSMSSWVSLPKIDESTNFDIPSILRIYKISPYFVNNFGKELLQILLTYVVGILINIFLKKLVTRLAKRMSILKKIYYFFAWDYTLIYMVSNFTKMLAYGLIKLRFSNTYITSSDKFDLIIANLMLAFCLLLIFHFYLKISTNFSDNHVHQISNVRCQFPNSRLGSIYPSIEPQNESDLRKCKILNSKSKSSFDENNAKHISHDENKIKDLNDYINEKNDNQENEARSNFDHGPNSELRTLESPELKPRIQKKTIIIQTNHQFQREEAPKIPLSPLTDRNFFFLGTKDKTMPSMTIGTGIPSSIFNEINSPCTLNFQNEVKKMKSKKIAVLSST